MAAVAAALVVLIGLAAFLIWREIQLDQRAEKVDAQAAALQSEATAVFGQVVARTNFVRGAVEASGRPELLDEAFALTVAWGASAGAAVLDVQPDGTPRVVRQTGSTELLAGTVAGTLPDQEDLPVLIGARASGDGVRIAHVSRTSDRIIYHESILAPRLLQNLTQAYEAIDFEIVATPLGGEETIIVRSHEGPSLSEAPGNREISGLGVQAELRTREAADLPPAVNRTAALLWQLLLLAAAVGTAMVVGAFQNRKRELLRKTARERELLFNSNHDDLTGLPNRRALFDHLEERPDGLISLLFVDLDSFKAVNDHYGHDGGDEVLTTVGHRLRESIRTPDMVFRLGGDEFVVVSESKAVATLKSRIERVLEVPVELDGGYASVSASVGAAVINCGEQLDVRAALRAADRAMYEEKAVRKAMKTLDEAGEI